MNFLSRLIAKPSTALCCPHCEREIQEGHDVDACARKRMSRRHFFAVGFGAAAALSLPTSGVAIARGPFTEFAVSGKKIGDTIQIRNPARFTAQDAMVFTPEVIDIQHRQNMALFADLEARGWARSNHEFLVGDVFTMAGVYAKNPEKY